MEFPKQFLVSVFSASYDNAMLYRLLSDLDVLVASGDDGKPDYKERKTCNMMTKFVEVNTTQPYLTTHLNITITQLRVGV